MRLIGISISILFVCSQPALSQNSDVQLKNEFEDLDQYLPELPDGQNRWNIEEPTIPQAGGNEIPIIDSLSGLVFVPSMDQFDKDGIVLKGIHIEGIPKLNHKKFRQQVESYLTKPLSLKQLNEIAQKVVLHMREQNRPVVDAVIPEQNIKTGTVQILVLIGTVGKIQTENNKYFSDKLIQSSLRLKPGEKIKGNLLKEDLDWLNQNPFRQVDLVYTQGESFGETDLIMRTRDRLPWRFYGGYENNGTKLTGKDRYFAGLNWGNAFGMDHLLNYQYTQSQDGNRLQAHTLSYFIPLPWRHKLWIFGSYSDSEPSLPDPLSLEATSWRISSRYIIPLKNWVGVEHEISFGTDYVESESDLFFTSFLVNEAPTTIAQGVIAYSASKNGRYGSTEFSLTSFLSPGGLFDNNTNRAFNASRAFAEAQYAYVEAEIEQVTRLPSNFAWIARFKGQLASGNLLASEQMTFGGRNSLRGYETNEVNADEGYIMSHELRTHSFPVLSNWFDTSFRDRMRMLVFWDFGLASNRRLTNNESERVYLSSIGPGLRYNVGSYLNLTLDWGFQLRETPDPSDDSSQKLEASLTISY